MYNYFYMYINPWYTKIFCNLFGVNKSMKLRRALLRVTVDLCLYGFLYDFVFLMYYGFVKTLDLKETWL